jgi:FADH2 O2-dependent halogenase
MPSRLREYASVTLEELDWTALLIAACYAAMDSFSHFAAFSMFYFTAASFSEMARRLNRGHLVRRFLAADHPAFADGFRACSASLLRGEAQRMGADAFERRVARCVECLNVAGLSDPGKRNWYGVDLNDVVVNAQKLGYTPGEMRKILACAPWAQIPSSAQ